MNNNANVNVVNSIIGFGTVFSGDFVSSKICSICFTVLGLKRVSPQKVHTSAGTWSTTITLPEFFTVWTILRSSHSQCHWIKDLIFTFKGKFFFLECSNRVTALIRIITDDALHIFYLNSMTLPSVPAAMPWSFWNFKRQLCDN